MNKKDFYFDLPEKLIAQYPAEKRSESRLLCLDKKSGKVEDRVFKDIIDHLQAGDLLVLNNTRVIPARLFGNKTSGGKVEVLIERITSSHQVLAFVKASRAPKVGSQLDFQGGIKANVLGRQDNLFELAFVGDINVLDILETYGEIPLPHYMHREAGELDRERYQTVFAQTPGAVAAPTAGLHFDDEILNLLQEKGIGLSYVTLHVGAGTFQPVRVEDITQHHMHYERIEVSKETSQAIHETKARNGRVIAVGTTVVRSLESAASSGEVQAYEGETNIFIFPGYEFKAVDALITNFHLPESTLIMLVSAFAGRENILNAYQHAIENEYRFFSYGDAMFIA